MLQSFVECGLKLHGNWSSPGGNAKKFTCLNSDLTITWYARKQNTLVLHGDASLALANTLITVCGAPTTSNEFTAKPNAVEDGELSDNICMPTISSVIEQRHNNNTNAVTADSIVDMTTEIPNQSFKSDVHSEKLKVRSNSFPCNVVHDFVHGCQCRLLAADLEEVKLDMVIMQRNMESKIFAIEKSRESEEINQLQKELSNEREKCKNLEADISILIRGRNREVNELNNTIVSLENRFKSSEAMNESLRQSIMQMKNHAIIDEISITSIVHSIDNPLGSSSFSGVFNSDDQPDDLPLCIKNFTTIDTSRICLSAHKTIEAGNENRLFTMDYIARLDFMLLFCVHSSKFGKCLLMKPA